MLPCISTTKALSGSVLDFSNFCKIVRIIKKKNVKKQEYASYVHKSRELLFHGFRRVQMPFRALIRKQNMTKATCVSYLGYGTLLLLR